MTDSQFFIQTTVQICSVAVALLVCMLAIWGTALRARWVGPKLIIKLHDPQGEPLTLGDGRDARYYHLRVENKRRSAQATNVRVVLTRVVRPAADGAIPQDALSGAVQLTWQHGHSLPQFPTLGPTQNADLGVIIKGEGFSLTPLFVPNNLNVRVSANQSITVEVQALSDQSESRPLTLEIAWDGQWGDDSRDMSRHLVIKETASTSIETQRSQ